MGATTLAHSVRALAALLVAGGGLVAQACSGGDDAPATPEPPMDAGAPDDAAGDAGPRSTGLAQTCARGAKVTARTGACNGAAELCDRPYDRVVTPMTHNAAAVDAEGFVIANQSLGLERQLEDGIRGMMLDTHYFDGADRRIVPGRVEDLSIPDQTYLCHGPCSFGNARLLDGLCTLTKFLDAHPDEVLSIIFENHIEDADTDAMLEASGLREYLYTHAPGTPWPTLGAMIEANQRLVVFLEKGGGTPAYLHPAWEDNVWDTPYTFDGVEAFSCAKNRGATENPLFLINHWLSPPSAINAGKANVEDVLGARVDTCTAETGRPPTFVGVDFYEVGALFPVVRRANGL